MSCAMGVHVSTIRSCLLSLLREKYLKYVQRATLVCYDVCGRFNQTHSIKLNYTNPIYREAVSVNVVGEFDLKTLIIECEYVWIKFITLKQ